MSIFVTWALGLMATAPVARPKCLSARASINMAFTDMEDFREPRRGVPPALQPTPTPAKKAHQQPAASDPCAYRRVTPAQRSDDRMENFRERTSSGLGTQSSPLAPATSAPVAAAPVAAAAGLPASADTLAPLPSAVRAVPAAPVGSRPRCPSKFRRRRRQLRHTHSRSSRTRHGAPQTGPRPPPDTAT